MSKSDMDESVDNAIRKEQKVQLERQMLLAHDAIRDTHHVSSPSLSLSLHVYNFI